MKKRFNKKFRCECCGATETHADMAFQVALIGDDGVVQKSVCFDCETEMEANNPHYLCRRMRFLDPVLQRRREERAREVELIIENQRKDFLESVESYRMEKEVIGKRNYDKFVNVSDPWFASCGKRLPIASGEYSCIVWNLEQVFDYEGVRQEAVDMSVMGIYLDGKIPAYDEMFYVGTVDIDSGAIGIFDDLGDDICDWIKDVTEKEDEDLYYTSIKEVGFIGWGDDGGADIYVFVEKGRITAVEVRVYDYVPRGN